MHTDFSLHFQWANNHSEPVPYLCTFCQPKMPTGTIWSFSNAKADVCSCRQHGLAGFLLFLRVFGFFFNPGFVCIIILFTDIGVFFWNEVWLPGCHEHSFMRAKGFLIKETSLCSYRRKTLVFNFHFFIWFARRNIFCSFFSHQRRLYWVLHVWLDHYYII